MKRMILLLPILLLFAVAGCGGGTGNPDPGGETDYRGEMRQFVQSISVYARGYDGDFIVIPQNGGELLSANGSTSGDPASGYIDAIDGVGREDLFYGYDQDNVATSSTDRDFMVGWMDYARGHGLTVLATDYCWDRAKMDDSYTQNDTKGYISFAADQRELNHIPAYPSAPHHVNSSNIANLGQVKNFLYLINPGGFSSKTAMIDAVKATNYDLIILDLFFNDSTLTAGDLSQLKRKANGGSRLVIAYMSIGEAEDYRYYWQASWNSRPPAWLERVDPNWPGNYYVRYWDPGWQQIIFGNDQSYTKRIIDAGFDGVYLDIVDGFEHFENS